MRRQGQDGELLVHLRSEESRARTHFDFDVYSIVVIFASTLFPPLHC